MMMILLNKQKRGLDYTVRGIVALGQNVIQNAFTWQQGPGAEGVCGLYPKHFKAVSSNFKTFLEKSLKRLSH